MRDQNGIAFSMPGGDVAGLGRSRPVDMAHLARQTMGDRALEQEVLGMFVQQALSVREKMADADVKERLLLAHGLKGSARGIGAFAVADCATEIENRPDDNRVVKRLALLIEDVRDFVAAINR
ncbi:MAG: Hpt domain-containing protein [Mesorhizobium sp.]|nr:Hpt domain-containing protein [Mesorhizobium sp.]